MLAKLIAPSLPPLVAELSFTGHSLGIELSVPTRGLRRASGEGEEGWQQNRAEKL